jgi:hypothetical protein
MDVSKKEQQWSKYQRKMNELAVSKEKQFAPWSQMLDIRPDLPIILCSGYSIDLVAPTSLDKYFKGHLMKPFLLGPRQKITARRPPTAHFLPLQPSSQSSIKNAVQQAKDHEQ